MESVEVQHYTVAAIRNWLMHNIAPEGLTNEVIRPAFAWVLIHHPDVKDEDPIVAAIYDNGALAASTCAFPEIMEKPEFLDDKGNTKRVWWFPMLWVKPEYRGKGYGLVVIGSLAEVYGMDCAWTAWAVPEAIEVFEFLGCNTYYFPRYFMNDKNIHTNSLKGKLAYLKQESLKCWHNYQKPKLPHYEYTLRYLNNVDDFSYEFICRNSKDNFFHSSQEVLNWEIQFPWTISIPLTGRIPKDGEYFQDAPPMIQYSFVQIWVGKQLVGVYKLRRGEESLSCDFIYYENKYAETVFASIVEHIQYLHATHFETEDGELAKFVQKYLYFPKCTTEQLSLSISPKVSVPEHFVR